MTWHMIISELRYHFWGLLAGYTGLALVYGLMTTDRLAYALLLGYMIGYSALLLYLSQVKEKREQQMALLPVPRWTYFLARISVPLMFCAGSVLIVWLLMQLPAYRSLHNALLWRMPGAFLVMAFYFVAAYSLADVKLEKDRGPVRFIYPGFLLTIWPVYYALYIVGGKPEQQSSLWYQMKLFTFESPIGVAIAFVMICTMLGVNLFLFQRRKSFVKC